MGIFQKLMKKMVAYYASTERGLRWRWQSIDSKSCAAPLGGEKTGKNPTDRGKLGAKIHLLVDERGAPLSVVLNGANRHDKVVAKELIVSVMLKRPVHREQHLCAVTAYDAQEIRELALLEGYVCHIKVNPRRRAGQSDDENLIKEKEAAEKIHPARRWVVERTISEGVWKRLKGFLMPRRFYDTLAELKEAILSALRLLGAVEVHSQLGGT